MSCLLSLFAASVWGEAGPADSGSRVFQTAELFQSGPKPWNEVIEVEGYFVSVCKRDGSKGWLRDADPESRGTLRIECTAGMKRLNQDVVGKPVRVRGILREKRLDAGYFDEWEARVLAAAAGEAGDAVQDGCSGDCGSSAAPEKTLERIEAFRKRLANSPHGYLSSIWIDGEVWEPVSLAQAP